MNPVEEYFGGFTGEKQERLKSLDAMITSLADGITTKLSWSMPTYSLPDGGVIVRFCAFKKHIGFFLDAEASKVFGERIAALGLVCTKGGVQFPYSQHLPLDLAKEIALFNIERADIGGNALWEVDPTPKAALVVPEELIAILKDENEARDFFDSLSDGYKRGYCDWVGGAKQQSTRKTRADKALLMLKNKKH